MIGMMMEGGSGPVATQDPNAKVPEGFHPADMAFKMFDKDGNGVLDKNELMAPIKKVCEKTGCPFPTSLAVAAVIKALDKDNSGTIDMIEFRDVCNKLAGTAAGTAVAGMVGYQVVGGGGDDKGGKKKDKKKGKKGKKDKKKKKKKKDKSRGIDGSDSEGDEYESDSGSDSGSDSDSDSDSGSSYSSGSDSDSD